LAGKYNEKAPGFLSHFLTVTW